MQKTNLGKIDFRKIHFPPTLKALFDVYYVVVNDRCKVSDSFNKLEKNIKDDVKALIIRMATNKDYKSDKIKRTLHGYTYGEIRPMPHRFFYFQKCGNNYIFFSYTEKKKNKLRNEFYLGLEKEKRIYAREFEKFIKKSKN